MATYLWQASYSVDGTKGLIKEGGSKRRAAVQQAVEKAGGKLLAFYFAFGESDVVGIANPRQCDGRGGQHGGERGWCRESPLDPAGFTGRNGRCCQEDGLYRPPGA